MSETATMKLFNSQDSENKSLDIVAENAEKLMVLFPECVVEGKIDFDTLKQLLSGTIEERDEKYGLSWHGKRQARQFALSPSVGTLRPCPEESVDWDSTQNLLVEGDNLEVLKLLQKTYAGKVKVIYIDPPYNTGKDFVYPDSFRDSLTNYLQLTGQTDESGQKVTSNTDSSGRFHTAWLNMIYPRLKLARNLLRNDGVVFVSIADHEIHDLRIVMNELYGEENFVATVIWQKMFSPKNSARHFSEDHDYLVVYAKNGEVWVPSLLPRTEEMESRYSNLDNDPRGPWTSGDLSARNYYSEGTYPITCPSGRVIEGPPPGMYWRVSKQKFDELDRDHRIWWGADGSNTPRLKRFLSEVKQGRVPQTLWTFEEVGHTQEAKKELISLVNFPNSDVVFDTPKPTRLIRRILQISTRSGKKLEREDDSPVVEQSPEPAQSAEPTAPEIVLDFFAGTGSTLEAVYRQNAEDGCRRRCILVQLPEPLPASTEKLRTIADITKERIRNAGKNVRETNPMFHGDLGFRVFKLDTTNIRVWEPNQEDLPQALLDSVDHVKPGRSESDVLYEVLLKLGLDLCVPIETRSVAGKDVHSVGGGVLFVSLPATISRDEAEPLALGIIEWHKELAPAGEVTCVFRDSAFADDVAKTNLAAILAQNGLQNVRSL